jgi:hypothetical protein
MKTSVSILAVITLLPAFARGGEPDAAVSLAPPTPAKAGNGWEFTLTCYAPLMGLEGKTGVSPFLTEIDVPFTDLVDELDAGFMAYVNARKDRWSITGDLIWIKASTSVNPNPFTYVGLKQEQTMTSLALGYSLVRNERTTLDLLGGAAYTGLELDLDVTNVRLPALGGVRSASERWLDPFVGFSLQHRFDERWILFARADVGGFGVSSDEYWQALLGLTYLVKPNVGVHLSYRWISLDYQQARFSYDIVTSGPCLGLALRF